MKLAINRSWMSSFALATTLILSGAAGASDGVIEINQTCATTTGCVAGDSGGFPVFIGATGTARSYILTSDLVPTNSGSVIFIDGDNVSLDMNGFSILCGPSSTFGIRYGFPQAKLRVSNGAIQSCNSGGIGGGPSGASSRIEGLTVSGAIGGGIDVGPDSIVENCSVSGSGSAGVGSSPTFSGIRLGTNGIARDNNVSGAVIGITAGAGSLISGNVARNNTDGLDGTSSTIINNTSSNNSDDGIVATGGSYVIGNTVRDNFTGLDLSTDSSYRGNSITGSTNSTIQASPAAVNQGQNTCIGPGPLSACP